MKNVMGKKMEGKREPGRKRIGVTDNLIGKERNEDFKKGRGSASMDSLFTMDLS